MFEQLLPFSVDKSITPEQLEKIPQTNIAPRSSTSPTSGSDSSTRKRKAHKKSRKGCQSCKVRRIKCDEGRPQCDKCLSYGVSCSYESTDTDLKFAGENSFVVEKPVRAPLPGKLILSSIAQPKAISIDAQLETFRWLPSDLEVFARFQERTVLTVGTKSVSNLYQNQIFKLAINYPFLTHVVLTLTLLHERHLEGLVTIGERATMHWLQGTALFKEGLIKPKDQSHRDALWASAAILGCIQFACIEARTPDEAWPLRPTASDDLDWLKMSDGKKAVWRIANTSNPESVFNSMKGHPELYARPFDFTAEEVASVTAEFCEVFALWPSSTGECNPYHDAAMTLARLLPVECNSETILEFLMFMSRIHPKLKTLLEQKDPKALLLVACWYAKIYRYQWWIHRRGLMEGTAICIYLDRYYGHAKSIQKLLMYPKVAFGLAFKDDDIKRQGEEYIMPRITTVAG